MIKILFICHGNICRSPMAEFICKDYVKQSGIAEQFHIESAATSREEIGNPVYPPARRRLAQAGISCQGKTARQVTRQDYDDFDYLICMENFNLRNLGRIIPADQDGKIYRLLDFTSHPRDIDDPWYTGDFDTAYDEIREGVEAFIKYLYQEKKIH